MSRRRGAAIHAEEVEVLRGKCVTLRPPRESDVEAAYSWDRDPELAAWNGRSPMSISLSAARRDYLARWQDPSVKTFIMETGEPHEPIGMVTLYDFRNAGCELGIKIGAEDLHPHPRGGRAKRFQNTNRQRIDFFACRASGHPDSKLPTGTALLLDQRRNKTLLQ